jgi:membrane-associated protein
MHLSLLGGDIFSLVRTAGYVGLFLMVFAESGLFFGFFLPGGSLLFTAGLLASQGFFNIYILTIVLTVAAITGDSVGYWFGLKIGPKIFTKEDSLFFHKKHVLRTHAFFEEHGAKAVIIGRFVPIVRTFVPILAGVGTMTYRQFLKYNIVGGIVWGIGMSALGYFLGNSIPGIQQLLLPIVIFIVILSVLPIFFGMMKKNTKDTI